MKIGLIDVDAWSRGKVTFPNLALMKVSSYHKSIGDRVEWYDDGAGMYDIVYLSRVFGDEYTKDYNREIHSNIVIRGGSGYAIRVCRYCMYRYNCSEIATRYYTSNTTENNAFQSTYRISVYCSDS